MNCKLEKIAKRLAIMLIQMIFLTIALFWLIRLLPGNAMASFAAPGKVTDFSKATLSFTGWLSDIWHGNFGQSMQYHQDVGQLIVGRLSTTVWLATFIMIGQYLAGIAIAIFGTNHIRLQRHLLRVSLFARVVPVFIIFLLANLMFGYRLNWSTPVAADIEYGSVLSLVRGYWVPVVIGILVGLLGPLQYTLIGLQRTKHAPWEQLYEQYGMSDKKRLYRHSLRHAVEPLAAGIGFSIVSVFMGLTVVETVFGISGVGRLMLEAILNRDYPVVIALTLFNGSLAIIGGLISDLATEFVAPTTEVV